jgi:cytochrome c553
MKSVESCAGLLVLASLAACSREPPPAPRPSLGNVMVQVARRFELAGRAAQAGRFELAEFEAGEIEETFENDVPGAELPKEGPTAQIPPLAKLFLQTNAPELREAAAKKDRPAFDVAFQHAAAACNGCHEASAKGFIHIPSEPGRPVPDVEALPASSAK